MAQICPVCGQTPRAVRRAQPQILLLFEGWTPKAYEQVFAGNDAAPAHWCCHVCRRVLDNTPRRNNAGPPRAGNEAIYIQWFTPCAIELFEKPRTLQKLAIFEDPKTPQIIIQVGSFTRTHWRVQSLIVREWLPLQLNVEDEEILDLWKRFWRSSF